MYERPTRGLSGPRARGDKGGTVRVSGSKPHASTTTIATSRTERHRGATVINLVAIALLAQHRVMDLHPRRPIPLALSLVAFAALALTVMAYWAHCGHTPPATRQAAGAGWGSAPARPAPSPTPPRLAPSSGPTDSATATAAHLQAARVVEQLTRLIDRGRLTLARRPAPAARRLEALNAGPRGAR